MISLSPLGDRAFLAEFDAESAARRWAFSVSRSRFLGVVDVVLAYQSAAVYADPELADLAQLERSLRSLTPVDEQLSQSNVVELPVLYDGEDLAEAARLLGLSESEVVALHSGSDYDVFAIGFLPGFPYAGYLPDRLRGLERRTPPRLRVPAGSVAIAGKQTGVYPQDSPGGWHLLGRTPLRIVDVARGSFPIRAGDRLRFVSITSAEYSARLGELLTTPHDDARPAP
jgi:KipI family sensor histidine kinase inhibitor